MFPMMRERLTDIDYFLHNTMEMQVGITDKNMLESEPAVNIVDETSVSVSFLQMTVTPEVSDDVNLFLYLYQPISDAPEFISKETPSGAIDGVNDTFDLAFIPIVNSEHIFLDGVLQTAYTITDNEIVFGVPPPGGSSILVSYIK